MFTRSILVSAAALAPLVVPPSAPPVEGPPAGTYTIDATHSTLLFRARHLGVAYFYGRFNGFKGEIVVDPAKAENSRVSVEIEMDSVDTASKGRDDHLKSPDFFDAVQFPTATFTSTSVKKKGDKHHVVAGKLSLHGVERNVTLEMETVGHGETPRGLRAGFHGVLDLKRSDFDMKFMLPDGVGDEVQVILAIEAVQGAKSKSR